MVTHILLVGIHMILTTLRLTETTIHMTVLESPSIRMAQGITQVTEMDLYPLTTPLSNM